MKSLRIRFTLAFLSLIILIYAMFFIGTHFFLENFYLEKNVKSMQDVEKNLNNILSTSTDTKITKSAADALNYNFSGNIDIIPSSGKKALSNADIEILCRAKTIKEDEIAGAKVFFVTSDFPVKDTEWMIYPALLKNGQIMLSRTPIKAISNSVSLIRKFINIIILISAVVAIFISILLSKNLNKPIKELKEMALSLRELDFKGAYEIDRKDEIGELSKTFKSLAIQLENTINSLNTELAKDKEINKMRKNFLAKASHELKTPITVIKSYTEALNDGIAADKEEENSYYEIIDAETDKMATMVNNLLQISLIDSDDFSLNSENFSLSTMLEKLAKDYSLIAEKKDILFTSELDDTKMNFIGDKFRLEQAFRNVLNNAFKFSNNKKPVLLKSEFKDGHLEISIENSGEKIDPAKINEVFELFHKGGSAAGSGIGLTVTANILKKHHIVYSISNTENGVKFTIIV